MEFARPMVKQALMKINKIAFMKITKIANKLCGNACARIGRYIYCSNNIDLPTMDLAFMKITKIAFMKLSKIANK